MYCKDCPNWKHSEIRTNYCEVFDWQSSADDFCSFEDRNPEPKEKESEKIPLPSNSFIVRNK